ncbi:MAG TPA: hypothetical protein VGL78_04175 [Solirubrobacteraceae bacterium]|jgi:hypothetical protein
MTREIEAVPERWTYLGRRESANHKLLAYWQMADGERALFGGKHPPRVVGGTYEVQVYRRPDGLSIGTYPTFIEGPSPEDEKVAEFEAEDRAASTANQIRKAEAKARAGSPERFGELTLNELRRNLARQPSLRRAALIGQILRYINAA